MKNILLVLVLFCVGMVKGNAQDIALLDNDNGFLGIRFGQDIDSIRRIITPVAISGDENEKTELYRVIKKQYYAFGTAQFKLFTINFFDNQIDNMYIDVTFENADLLLKELESVYGPGTKSNPKNEVYFWYGKKVTMQYIHAGGGASLSIMSNIMKRKKEIWKQKKMEKAFDNY